MARTATSPSMRLMRFPGAFVAALGLALAVFAANPPAAASSADPYDPDQSTGVVWAQAKGRLNYEIPWFEGKSGNAKNWLASARAKGLETGSQAVAESVAVYSGGVYDPYCDGLCGHVAYVVKVRGDTMLVNESDPVSYGAEVPATVGTVRYPGSLKLKLEGFIYLPGGGRPTEPPHPPGVNCEKKARAALGLWEIIPHDSPGKRLTLANAASAEGNELAIRRSDGTRTQVWHVEGASGSYVASVASGQILSFPGGAFRSYNKGRGKPIVAASLPRSNERWSFYSESGRLDDPQGFRICSADRPNYCLDASGGRVMLQRYAKGKASQLWRMEEPGTVHRLGLLSTCPVC